MSETNHVKKSSLVMMKALTHFHLNGGYLLSSKTYKPKVALEWCGFYTCDHFFAEL
jgi:hypothetical protein